MQRTSWGELPSFDQTKELMNESKQVDASKFSQNFRLIERERQQSQNYYINQQGVDNRRSLFDQVSHEQIAKQISEVSVGGEQDLEESDVRNYHSHPQAFMAHKTDDKYSVSFSQTGGGIINSQNLLQYEHPDQTGFDSPINSNKSLALAKKSLHDNTNNQGDNYEELTKERSGENPLRSPGQANTNSQTSVHALEQVPIRNGAKQKRQSMIAMKIKGAGLQQILSITPKLSPAENFVKGIMMLTRQSNSQIIPQQLSLLQQINGKNAKEIIENKHSFGNGIIPEEEIAVDNRKKQHLIILTYMKRFINQLLKRLSYKKLSLVTMQHLQMIDDLAVPKSSYQQIVSHNLLKNSEKLDILSRRKALQEGNNEDETSNYSFMQRLLKMSKQSSFVYCLISQIPIIQPQSMFLIMHEAILLLILLFYLMFTPMKASFDFTFDEKTTFSLIAYKIPVFIFLLDIFLGFHTGYYELGRVVLSRKSIAKCYLKKKFWVDSFCTLMMILNTFVIYSSYLNLFNLVLRINQMMMKITKINEHFRIQNRYPVTYEMIKLAMIILFMSHICGCGFHLVGNVSAGIYPEGKAVGSNVANYQGNWITYQNLDDSEWLVRYIYSIYFAIITMITVGYGDVFPINIYEKIYVMGMTLISCGLFAYCVNAVSSIFSQISQKSVVFKQKQYDLLNYMSQKNITPLTQTKIMKYLDYLEEESDQNISRGEQVLDQFPAELKEQLMREYFVRILVDVPILKQNFSNQFLNAISLKMKEKRLGPGEQILSKSGQLENLQFITKGNIEYSMNDGEHQRQICSVNSDKSVIDFRLFVTGLKSSVSIQSSTITNIAYIPFSDFFEELKKYHKDLEQFWYLRDQFLNDGRYEKTCPSCNQYGHEIDDCPQIHYCINRSVFSQRVFYSSFQPRQNNSKVRGIDQRYSWRSQYNTMKNDLKYIRWAYIVEQHNLYNEISIDEELKVIESDRQFFKRCPKINIKRIIREQNITQSVGGNKQSLEVIDEESIQSYSESDQSEDFYTEYSDSFSKNDTTHRTEDPQAQERSLQSNQVGDKPIESMVNGVLIKEQLMPKPYEERSNQSQSSIAGDIEFQHDYNNIGPPFQKHQEDQGGGSTARNFNGVEITVKSETSIHRADSMKKKTLFNPNGLNQASGQAPFSLTWVNGGGRRVSVSENTDKEIKQFMRGQSRHMTGRSLAGIVQQNQQNGLDKGTTNQNSFISYQQDRGLNQPSNMSNSGFLGNPVGLEQQFNSSNTNNLVPGGGIENIIVLDNLVNKLKKQCMKMMSNNNKLDVLSIPTHSRDDATRLRSHSKSSQIRLNTHNGTLVSLNTVNKSEKTNINNNIPLDLKTKSPGKDLIAKRTSVRYLSIVHPQHHIFGKLEFKADTLKEYTVYYPKGNASNVIKIYKKIMQIKNFQAGMKTIKNKQSGITDAMIKGQTNTTTPQIPKFTSFKHSKHSQQSSIDYK